MAYSSEDKVAFSLDSTSDYLLVPQPLGKSCPSPDLRKISSGGPKEYLVLKENEITFDGEECDKAGVTYAAFARQSHRCQHRRGSCLKNQPMHFYREDRKSVKQGKQGTYFLSNFLQVADHCILQNTSSSQMVLRAPYDKPYQSHVILELNADQIEIIGDKSQGQITEVYIDATSDKVTIVKAVITNMGIAVDFFGVDFTNCTSPLGPSDFDKPGKDEIPPQHRITYTATISTPGLRKDSTSCMLGLYNQDQDLVASRKIVIVRKQRCMCVWHCQCVCYDYPRSGLLCTPLSLQEYHLAGFPGHLPITTFADCKLFYRILQGLLWFFLILLLFGLVKAILGLCFSAVGVFGLWYILPYESRCLPCYLEPSLACYSVRRDYEGFAVHPVLGTRTVHFLPWHSEFTMNLLFFICILRRCVCDSLCQRASYMFVNQQQPYATQCSPGMSTRCGSPCRSPCGSNRRGCRLVAGGESSQDLIDINVNVNKEDVAQHRVDELLRAFHVYRNLTRPIGGVQSVPGTPYCIRGYFLESENGCYEFSPPSPLMQIYRMDGSQMAMPVALEASMFRVVYRTVSAVLAARELSPWPHGVVINVTA